MLKVKSSILEIEIKDYYYHIQLHFSCDGCKIIEDKNLFKPYRLKIVSNFSFFTSKSLFEKRKTNAPDIKVIVDMLNRYEEKQVCKIITLC